MHPHKDSALFRAIAKDVSKKDDAYLWGLPEYLLANISDCLSILAWGLLDGKTSNKPKPIPRPFDDNNDNKNVVVHKGESISRQEAVKRLQKITNNKIEN